MGRFAKTRMTVHDRLSCFRTKTACIAFITISLFMLSGIFLSDKSMGGERGTMAVLPFVINTPKPLDHLKTGLQKMFSSRMEKMGFKIVSLKAVNRHPSAFSPGIEAMDLVGLGKELSAQWVISGSLTQIGNRASIDLKVIDVSQQRPPFSIFLVSEDMDELTDTVERLAVSIDDRITGVPQIDSLRVAGNRRIEKAAVLAVVDTKAGDRLDYNKLDKDLRDVYKMGFFKDVRMEIEDGPAGKVVVFHVTEKPSVGEIVFVGNKEADEEDLKKELGISLYSILDNNEVRQSIGRLKEYYRQKGYYNAQIDETTEPLPNNEVSLKYKIDEHDKVYIEKIRFVGNTKFDADELRDIMETSEKWFLSWITKAGVLDEKKLEFDVHKITSFYHNQGFIKANVGDPEVVYIDKIGGLVVTIEIDEGHQYGVDEVSVEGDLIEPEDQLLEKLQIGKQEYFNREIMRKDILALRDIYADEGYAYSEIRPDVREDNEKYVADITYKISKGPKVRFERITISGNTVTRDKVIRRELEVVEGEYFSGKALKKSSANLNRLGFFEDLQVQTKKGSRDDLMNLDINVKEKGTRTFSVGAGYSSAYSAFVMFEIADENFLGYGQKLQATARIGGKNTEYDIRFVEPWLFDTRLSFAADVYKWTQEYDDYTRDSLGAAVSLGFPLIFEYTRGLVRYDYDDADISDIASTASDILKDMEGRNVTSSVTFRVKRDSRDKLWNTSRGSINEGSVQFAGLGGDEEFLKYRLRTTWFFPLFWDTVFMVQGRWGYIQDRGKLSVYQKFFLGGINTMRGFDYWSISPVDSNGDKIGGEKMMCYNLEYRFPVLKEQGVVGLVFFDAGNVFTGAESWTFDGIRKSAGVGVRWYSPVGPLRLEYGFNLDPQGDESAGKFEFSVGGLL